MHNPIYAAAHVQPMGQGQATAQLLKDDDHKSWVVKSLSSLQAGVSGSRTLFNDYVGTRLAEELGLPVARAAAIAIDNDFLEAYQFLRLPENGSFTRGFHFASEWLPGNTLNWYFTTMRVALGNKPDLLSSKIINKDDANGILAYDTWVANADRAHGGGVFYHPNDGNLFLQSVGRKDLRLVMIDQGLAFMGDWHEDTTLTHPYPAGRLGAWPNMLFGSLDFYHANNMLSIVQMDEWCDNFANCNLKMIMDIIDEVPTAWRRDIDSALATRFATNLLQRTLALKSTISSSFPAIEIAAAVRIGAW